MALATFANLQTSLADWAGNRGTDFSSVEDDFVLMAESRLNHGDDDERFPSPSLRVREMQRRATATITGEYLALPTDYLEGKSLKLTSSAKPRDLIFTPSHQFDAVHDTSLGGEPTHFTITGNEFRFWRIGTSGTVEVHYYEKIPALSGSNTSNWLLATAPNIYLYACLLEASIYIQEDLEAIKYARLVSGLVMALNRSEKDSELIGPVSAINDVRPPSYRFVRT